MILGMSAATFTLVHVLVSLIGIFAGAVVLSAMIDGRLLGGWNAVFLVTTIATSVTGFLFHSSFGPPHAIGVISLVVLELPSSRSMAGSSPDSGVQATRRRPF